MRDKEMNREHLERIYQDCLRKQYPTYELFETATLQYLASQQYEFVDLFKLLSRDILLYIVDKLSLSEVSCLARTCKRLARLVQAPGYNQYWKLRYMRDFIQYPPNKIIPSDISSFNGKRDNPIPVVWFDLYQYITKAREGKKSRKLMRAKTLKAFLERKKRTRINDFGWTWPDIKIGPFDKGEHTWIPQKVLISNGWSHSEVHYCLHSLKFRYHCNPTILANLREWVNKYRWDGIDITEMYKTSAGTTKESEED